MKVLLINDYNKIIFFFKYNDTCICIFVAIEVTFLELQSLLDLLENG